MVCLNCKVLKNDNVCVLSFAWTEKSLLSSKLPLLSKATPLLSNSGRHIWAPSLLKKTEHVIFSISTESFGKPFLWCSTTCWETTLLGEIQYTFYTSLYILPLSVTVAPKRAGLEMKVFTIRRKISATNFSFMLEDSLMHVNHVKRSTLSSENQCQKTSQNRVK